MRNVFLATVGLSAMLAIGATAANAADATAVTCLQAQHKVASALTGDTSTNHDAATKESNYGREYCNTGLYKRGMEHYAQAMKLLGIS